MNKKSFRIATISAGLAILAASAGAQEAFVVATGDAKGGSTYSKVFNEFKASCPIVGNEQTTTGSAQNLQLLSENKVSAAIIQSDLLFFTKMTDEAKVANIRTLFSLYPEELHFIARGDVKKEGGYLGGRIGGKEVTFNTLDDIAGRTIGAVGGSVLSGRVVSTQSGLKFNVQEYPTNAALQKALLEGQVDSILVVGGAPHDLVKTLTAPNFKLLSISPDMQKKLSGVYAPTKLSYSNLNQAGVASVTTQALMVTRTYRAPATLQALAQVRSCFEQKLPVIQDARGTHAKWQLIEASDKGKWAWYDLPAAK